MGIRLFATRTDEVVTVVAGQRTDYAGVTGPRRLRSARVGPERHAELRPHELGPVDAGRYIDSGLYNVALDRPERPALQPDDDQHGDRSR